MIRLKLIDSFLRKILYIILLIITVTAIADPLKAVEPRELPLDSEIQDVLTLPQNPFFYLTEDYNRRLITEEEQSEYLEEFKEFYFSPWFQEKPRHGMDVQEWIFSHFGEKQGYGENRRLRTIKWLEEQRARANLSALGTLNRKAVSVRETDLRLLPTPRPFFYDFNLPGEGYPFDYLQNSAVHAGEPLFISHLSGDGAWAWSETSYAAGWVKIEDIAFVNDGLIQKWTHLPLGVVIADNFPIKDQDGQFCLNGRAGTILPITGRYITRNRIIIPLRGLDGNAIEGTALLSSDKLGTHPLPFTSWNAALICETHMEMPYGWGGYGQNRDCSATIRDIFLPFGIWLPRNSGAQAKTGITIDLENMENTDKIHAILREARPFCTLVNKKGHVMLYIGRYRENPLILHNTWGIRTLDNGKEGRKIIGKTVITTLAPGKELPDLYPGKGLLIDSITGITLLGGIR